MYQQSNEKQINDIIAVELPRTFLIGVGRLRRRIIHDKKKKKCSRKKEKRNQIPSSRNKLLID